VEEAARRRISTVDRGRYRSVYGEMWLMDVTRPRRLVFVHIECNTSLSGHSYVCDAVNDYMTKRLASLTCSPEPFRPAKAPLLIARQCHAITEQWRRSVPVPSRRPSGR